jgi:quercetin dioxygenase-like cupin family protein
VTTQLITQPYHLPRDAGPARWHLGALLTFKATTELTAGRLWAKELLAARGMATPVHRHSREDEAFYVLDGEVSVYVGDDVVRAGTGDFVWAPRGVAHAFCVESPQARMLVVATPGGFERFFFDTGEPAGASTIPPRGGAPRDLDALVAALADHGVDVLGPAPAPMQA